MGLMPPHQKAIFTPALTTWASFVYFVVCVKYRCLGEDNIIELSACLYFFLPFNLEKDKGIIY